MLVRQRRDVVELTIAIALIAAPFVLPHLGAAPNTVNRILVWGLFGIGFDILFGYTGLLSFGQAAFYGTGGMVAAYLLTLAGFPARHDRTRDRHRGFCGRRITSWASSRCAARASTSR